MGGVTTSEFAIFMAHDAETAFVNGADLSAILAACATVETYLRIEAIGETKASSSFKELVEKSELPSDLKSSLDKVRIFRNRWVHVRDPSDDRRLLKHSQSVMWEIAEHADLAIKCMIQSVCSNPWI